MKNLLLLWLFAGFSQVQAQTGPSTYGFSHAEHIRATGYEFKLLRTKPSKDHWRMGYFQFLWKGPEPIRLWGFDFEKEGSFRVRFENFSKLAAGAFPVCF